MVSVKCLYSYWNETVTHTHTHTHTYTHTHTHTERERESDTDTDFIMKATDPYTKGEIGVVLLG